MTKRQVKGFTREPLYVPIESPTDDKFEDETAEQYAERMRTFFKSIDENTINRFAKAYIRDKITSSIRATTAGTPLEVLPEDEHSDIYKTFLPYTLIDKDMDEDNGLMLADCLCYGYQLITQLDEYEEIDQYIQLMDLQDIGISDRDRSEIERICLDSIKYTLNRLIWVFRREYLAKSNLNVIYKEFITDIIDDDYEDYIYHFRVNCPMNVSKEIGDLSLSSRITANTNWAKYFDTIIPWAMKIAFSDDIDNTSPVNTPFQKQEKCIDYYSDIELKKNAEKYADHVRRLRWFVFGEDSAEAMVEAYRIIRLDDYTPIMNYQFLIDIVGDDIDSMSNALAKYFLDKAKSLHSYSYIDRDVSIIEKCISYGCSIRDIIEDYHRAESIRNSEYINDISELMDEDDMLREVKDVLEHLIWHFYYQYKTKQTNRIPNPREFVEVKVNSFMNTIDIRCKSYTDNSPYPTMLSIGEKLEKFWEHYLLRVLPFALKTAFSNY